MALSYLHGIETIELATLAGSLQTVKSNVIHVTGTAPNANPDTFPLNVPVPVFQNSLKAADLKTDGTLLDAMDAIYSQGAGIVVVTRIAEGATENETWSNVVGSASGKTGMWSALKSRPLNKVTPKLLIAPGLTADRPSNGVVNAAIAGNGGSGYNASTTSIVVDPAPANGRTATVVPQIVGGKLTGAIVTDAGFGYAGTPKATVVGEGSGAVVELSLGLSPNPVGMVMKAIAPRLRAFAFVDGPSTSYQDAVQYRNDYGSDRIMVLDPGVLAYDTTLSDYVQRPASAYAAGLQARIDSEQGFWFPFSNNEIANIGGPSRPVDWEQGDRDSEANLLNASQVTTIIHDDGFRFWGLRSTADAGSLWSQMAVRRTADMVYESLEKAHRDRLDKPFSYELLDSLQDSVNSYLKLLKGRGALIGGKCQIPQDINTPATFANGELTVDFDLEPPASLEHLTFRASRNPAYYTDFLETFTRISISA